jgi:hypothetical protein
MNPPNNEASGNQLPPAVQERAPSIDLTVEEDGSVVEQSQAATAEKAPAPARPGAAVPPLTIPVPPAPTAALPQSGVSGTTPAADSPLADDGDLIEKEWVNKAKRIVDNTREDPYKQSEELTVVKADYMQQRYNKAIKLNK